MANQQVIVEFISDTSKLTPAEKQLVETQQKVADATDKANKELAEQTKVLKEHEAAARKDLDTTTKREAVQRKTIDNGSKQRKVTKETTDELKKKNAESEKDVRLSANAQAVYDKLTQSLTRLDKEGRKVVQTLLQMDIEGVADGFRDAGVTVDQFIDRLSEQDKVTTNVKTRMRELKAELNALALEGKENTEEFRALSAEAGQLDDQIKDVNATIKALGSDTRAIDGVIDAVGALAGGFAAVQGASALFADENEDLQKALLKVSAAMSLLQGIQQIQNVLQKESAASVALLAAQQKILTLQTNLAAAAESRNIAVRYAAITAQRILNAVMAANPIGLVVTAVLALVSALAFFVSGARQAAIEQSKLNSQLQSAGGLLDAEVEGYERANKKIISDLEARGAKQSEIEKQNQKNRKFQLQATERELADLQRVLATSNAEEQGAAIEKVNELESKAADLRTEIYVGENKIKSSLREEDEKDREKKEQEREKKEQDAAKRREDRLKAEIDAARQLEQLRNDIVLQGIANEFERRREAINQQLKQEIEDVRNNELLKNSTKLALIKELNTKASNEIEAINREQRKAEEEAERAFQKELSAIVQEIQLNAIKDQGERELQAIKNNYARQKQQILEDTTKTYEQKAQLIEQLLILEGQAIAKQEKENRRFAANDRIAVFDEVVKDSKKSTDVRLAAIRDERVLLVQLYAEGILDRKEYNAQIKKLVDEENALYKQQAGDEKSRRNERLESTKQTVRVVANIAQSTIGIVSELFKRESETRLNAINEQKNQVQELEKTGQITTKEAQRRLLKLDAEEKRIRQQQAKRDKAVALFQAVVNTASAIAEALPNVPLSIAAGVLGAAQIALIATRPIPQFRTGKKDAYQGPGIVGEAGRELVESGGVKVLYDKPTLVWLNKEDRVHTPEETSRMLTIAYKQDAPNTHIPMSEVQTEQKAIEIDYDKIGESVARNMPQYGLNIDEDGFTSWVQKRNAFTKYLDKRRTA